jgi:hypothetical protein
MVPNLVEKIIPIFGTLMSIFLFTTTHHLSITLSQNNIFHSLPKDFFKIHFNIILQSTPRSSKCSLSIRFHHQTPICTSLLLHTCHMPYPSHSSLFTRPRGTDHEAAHCVLWLSYTVRRMLRCWPLEQLPSWRTTLCRLSAMANSMYLQLPSISETQRVRNIICKSKNISVAQQCQNIIFMSRILLQGALQFSRFKGYYQHDEIKM